MAGAFIHVTVDKTSTLELMQRVAKKAGNTRPAMKIIGEVITSSVKENFMRGGRPTAWKPLSAATLIAGAGGSGAYKKSGALRAGAKRKIASKKILISSGTLFRSIHPSLIGNNSVAIGTDRIYGAIHHFGFSGTETVKQHTRRGFPVKSFSRTMNIPARPYLLMQAGDYKKCDDAILDWLMAP